MKREHDRMKHRKIVILIVLAALIAPLPSGCKTPSPSPSDAITLRQAFRTVAVEDGILDPDNICFYRKNGDSAETHLVSAHEILEYEPPYPVPHADYYEQFLPDGVKRILPILEYAISHEYSRICIPSEEFHYGLFSDSVWFLAQIYFLDFDAAEVASFPLENGHTLRYMLVTMFELETGDMEKYRKSHETAWDIVQNMPDSCETDFQKAQYLYHFLTENVEYDDGDYYESEYDLAYDALVKHSTVCAGYAAALFYLYNMAGIDCIYLYGYLDGGGEGKWHAWNAAKIDGRYYLFDATWDTGNEIRDYRFFGISSGSMQEFYPRSMVARIEEYHPVCDRMLTESGSPGSEG